MQNIIRKILRNNNDIDGIKFSRRNLLCGVVAVCIQSTCDVYELYHSSSYQKL